MEVQGRRGPDGQGELSRGQAKLGRQGMDRLVPQGLSWLRHCVARPVMAGTAKRGLSRRCVARRGWSLFGLAGTDALGMFLPSKAGYRRALLSRHKGRGDSPVHAPYAFTAFSSLSNID